MAAARTRRILAATALAALAVSPRAPAGDGDVAALQVALHANGVYAGPIDGLAGPLTEQGVRSFQRAHGLPADGAAGPLTRGALGPRGRPALGSRILERGHSGWDAAALQFRLAEHGFPSGTLDGIFGARTEAAVRRFQEWAGLAVDGRAGPATLASLGSAPPAAPIAFVSPVDVPAGDRFGPRGLRFHTGVDYAAPAGTAVRAAAAGRVTWAGWLDAGYGVVVVVDHGNGVRSWYAHLASVDVSPGMHVDAGATVGGVGSTGWATGPHLHFEVRVRGAAVDPAPALSG